MIWGKMKTSKQNLILGGYVIFYRAITNVENIITKLDKNYDEHHFAYAVFDGLNVRIFRPYLKSQGIDKLPLQSVGNYVFGFSHLPDDMKDCAMLFIVGGERRVYTTCITDVQLTTNDFPVFLNLDTNTYEVDVLRIFLEKESELQGILRGMSSRFLRS